MAMTYDDADAPKKENPQTRKIGEAIAMNGNVGRGEGEGTCS